MNLIVCDEHCKHQQEGYCTLNAITRLTNDTRAKCGYYEDIREDLRERPHLTEGR